MWKRQRRIGGSVAAGAGPPEGRGPGGRGDGLAKPAGSPVVSAQEITKTFASTRALADASLELCPGEVHALVGENGAGKSTLVKVLVGALQPDRGTLLVRGTRVRFGGVRDALAHGIFPIYQQLSLMPHLSVLENLSAFELSRGTPWSMRPHPRRIMGRVQQALESVGLDVDPHRLVEGLPLAERQLVEIARGLVRDGAVLILDEPTAVLNQAEVDRLFTVVHGLRGRGWAVLFISHRLDEVHALADRVSVLRDGRIVVGGARVGDVSPRDLVEAMVGGVVEQASTSLPLPGPEVLRAEGLTAPGAFRDVSLSLRQGEIVGIVGLIGSGAEDLGAALAGAVPVRSGNIRVGTRRLRIGDRGAALSSGVGLIPVDREQDGIFRTLSALQNASVSVLPEISTAGFFRRREERARLTPWFQALAVRPTDPDAPMLSLSGGNQQKVLFIRSVVSGRKRILIALEPTRGVDVRAREEIHRALVEAARSGLAVAIVSSDLEEVTALASRIFVMRDARLVAELPATVEPSVLLGQLTGAVP